MVKISTPTPTEVVHPGQPSSMLLAALKAAGESVTIEQLAKSLGAVEAARVGFVVEAIATGILLLARKQTLKHGEWQAFAAKVWKEIKGNAVSQSAEAELHNFTRTLRHYCFLAQHFVADLEQGNFQPDGQLQPKELGVKPVDVLALDTLPQEQRIAVYNQIERFVAGRSLRRMLIEFRRAENAADQEELDEAAEAARKKRGKGKPVDPRQMQFEEMLQPLGVIDTLFDSKSFVEKTDKAFWLSVAAKLTTQAERARKLAKEIR